MRKRNLTPFLFATKTTSRKPPSPEATVVVRGRFAIAPGVLEPHADPGRMSGDLFDEDDPDAKGASNKPSDLSDFKLHGEVLLTGVCHAPGGKPTGESFVRVAVRDATSHSKVTIDRRVFGPRVWTEALVGKAFTDPLPFTTMQLDWAHAFGGDGFADNPTGKGIATHELPNVEWADVITSKHDRPRPACPGPISPFWPARMKKVGVSYGKEWKKTRAPYYAEDFDWSYFQSAPPDQWLDGYFHGDETLELVNLHPTIPNIECKLPALRVRVFVRDVHGHQREVPLVLDTLHVDSAEGFVDLTWRGITSAIEQDLTDLAFAIIASEPLAERPRPVAHYESLMTAFVADPLGMRDAIPAELRPAYDRAQKLAAEEEKRSATDASEVGDPLASEIERAAALLEPEQAAQLRAAVKEMNEAAKKAYAQATAAVRDAGKPPPPPIDEAIAKAVLAAKRPLDKPAVDFDPDGKPRIELAGAVNAQKEAMDRLRAQSDLPAEARTKLEDAAKKLDDPRLAELDPTLAGGARLVDPGPNRDLRRRDLRGRDLSGMDLSGSDLRGALLSKARLAGANLRGTIFSRALADAADLRGADLTGAKLDEGIFFDADLRDAKLDGATCDTAVFARAKLDGASLVRVKGALAILSKASLKHVKATALELLQSDLSDCDLEEADFTRASLVRCLLRGAKAQRAVFEGSRLGHVCFEEADLTDARFARAAGPCASFMSAKLDRTDFSHVVLPGAHFSGAHGTSTQFYAANLPDSRFSRAHLKDAKLEKANLMNAELGLAVLPHASFRGASLFNAKLLGTQGEGCNFLDANLKRSTLEGN
ncbi:MAG: DUF2169 domain-containing protein [Polyangiaceae bacterium]|nr:DUF2169 domain-containing protein [Polyangiaceae bacterium]